MDIPDWIKEKGVRMFSSTQLWRLWLVGPSIRIAYEIHLTPAVELHSRGTVHATILYKKNYNNYHGYCYNSH